MKYPDDYINKIICGDNLVIMEDLPDNVIDLILTDPPYGTTNCEWDEKQDLEKMWIELKRVGKNHCVYIFTTSQPFTTDLINSNREWFKYEWIWNKKMAGNIGFANKMPLKIHENIIVFYNKKPIYNPQFHNKYTKLYGKFSQTKSKSVNLSSKTKKLSGKRGFPRTILEFMRPNNLTGGGLHPTQKPVDLLRYLVKTYSDETNLILDPFLGSGTTAVACKQLNRRFIGVEINPDYCKIARERLMGTPESLFKEVA